MLKTVNFNFKRFYLKIAIPIFFFGAIINAETILNEDFESFITGSLNGHSGWIVNSGNCIITDDSNNVKSGDKAACFIANNQTLIVQNTSFSGSESGVSEVVYVDFWVKINSMADKDFAISGYDLFGGSQKRTFVLEFDEPLGGGSGIFRIYDGSLKKDLGQYVIGKWYRISAKVDYSHSVYTLIFNDWDAITANFREEYTPTASGTRSAGVKEYHQIRMNLGYDSAIGSLDAVIDDIYVGTDPIPDVNFPIMEINFSIRVEQPNVGEITLIPGLDEYPENSEVTALLTLPEGYQNMGWTGDLSGTELQKTFIITHDMTIGAIVAIDPENPPDQYTITVKQPDFGRIILDPAGELFYKYTNVTIRIEIPVGYLFEGWTDDLNGTEFEQGFIVLENMVIGAIVIPDTIPPSLYIVSNATELKNVCKGSNLKPGDIVEVLDGNYDIGGLSIESSGTYNQPIIIRSKNIGGAVLLGNSYFDLRRSSYIQIEGFDIRSNVYTAIKLQACNNVRITRNVFNLSETEGQSGKWILIGGIWNDPSATSHHNRIDHNIFKDKRELGNFITIDGQQEPYNQMSQYDRIDHNYFFNIGPRAVNEMEAVRVGVSDLSMSSAFCIIEYNLFEECNGDPEIISVKSCDNIIRYNTFRSCEGSLCLRHGNRNEVNGNFFLGEGKEGTGGVRIYAQGHKIYNNYFEGLKGHTWDAAITLTNGDTEAGSLSAHWQINNLIVCHNTLVNNYSNIEIGYAKEDGSWKKEPKNVTVANNLVVGEQADLVKIITKPTNLRWSGNIMYAESGQWLGVETSDGEILNVDPVLLYIDSLWLLSPDSPAIDAVTNSYLDIDEDIQGQPRIGLNDVGADEFSSAAVTRFPLTTDYVGPFAKEIPVITEIDNSRDEKTAESFRLVRNYPNPFNMVTTIIYSVEKAGEVILTVYNVCGQKIDVLENQTMNPGNYSVQWNAGNLPSGVYWLCMETSKAISVLPVCLLK